ncbi:MAG: DUF29 domain-containing protein [Nodosilinea sp.]
MQTTTLYDQDFYGWTQRQVDLLRTGRWEDLDIENLVEEIESLGRQERQELRNRLGCCSGICSSGTTNPKPALKAGQPRFKSSAAEFSVT